MQTKSVKYRNCALLIAALCVISAGILITSCQKEEEDTTVALYSFGPMPVARGAELKFIGKNLDKVTAIVIPNNINITTFTTKTSTLLTLTVPQEAVPGLVVLKTPDGDITTKTEIGFSEPISISGFSPATIKPGSELTITGDYLNLVGEVIFTDRITVPKTSFVSQSRTQLKVVVPATAQTGKIAVSDAEEDPVIVYSATNLTVKLPAFTTIAPNPVKAGSLLTITGTDLDLVKTVTLGGNKNITTFVSQTATQIELNVPADTRDGKVSLTPQSGVKVESSEELIMVVPTVSVTPTTLKNGADITVTGTDLDLVDKVTFGGNKQGTIKAGGTETQILVTVPDNAISGVVTFITKATKEVAGPELTLIDPVFTSFDPTSGKANTTVNITGTDLDLVADVYFGGTKGSIGTRTETQLAVTVPIGANSGKIKLVAKNGTEVLSSGDFTVLANLPNFTGFSEPVAKRGAILTLNGTNMDLIKSLVFPGDIVATEYGLKTATYVQVYVPWNANIGYGQIKINTYEGEQGYVPPTSTIFIGGVEPVKATDLIINDFDEPDHNLYWDNWSGISLLMDDGNGVSGKYLKGGNAALGAWSWSWIWGCNHSQLPKHSANTATYVLKLDIKITAPISSDASRFQFKLGSTDSKWVKLGLINSSGAYATEDWVTITLDLVNDLGFSGTIPASGDWGMIVQPAAALDFTAVNIDNIRFSPK